MRRFSRANRRAISKRTYSSSDSSDDDLDGPWLSLAALCSAAVAAACSPANGLSGRVYVIPATYYVRLEDRHGYNLGYRHLDRHDVDASPELQRLYALARHLAAKNASPGLILLDSLRILVEVSSLASGATKVSGPGLLPLAALLAKTSLRRARTCLLTFALDNAYRRGVRLAKRLARVLPVYTMKTVVLALGLSETASSTLTTADIPHQIIVDPSVLRHLVALENKRLPLSSWLGLLLHKNDFKDAVPIQQHLYTAVFRSLVSSCLNDLDQGLPAHYTELLAKAARTLSLWRQACACDHCVCLRKYYAMHNTSKLFKDDALGHPTAGGRARRHVRCMMREFVGANPLLGSWGEADVPEDPFGSCFWMLKKSSELYAMQRSLYQGYQIYKTISGALPDERVLSQFLGPLHDRLAPFVADHARLRREQVAECEAQNVVGAFLPLPEKWTQPASTYGKTGWADV